MSYNLFLDDERQPQKMYLLTTDEVYAGEWIVVKSFNEFKECIMNHGLPKRISFDHDLADEHYEHGALTDWKEFDYSKVKEKTGLDCLKWLIEYTKENNLDLSVIDEFLVHSFNPIGRENILNLLRDIFKIKK